MRVFVFVLCACVRACACVCMDVYLTVIIFSVFLKKSDNEDVIESPSDLLPYKDKMIADLLLLGTVLGIGDYTSAIMKEPGDPQSRCINILSHWLKVTPHPTWTLFCDKLKRAKEFTNLRSKICREHI